MFGRLQTGYKVAVIVDERQEVAHLVLTSAYVICYIFGQEITNRAITRKYHTAILLSN